MSVDSRTYLLNNHGIFIQYSTVQYSTVQYSTVQYNTIQYTTILIRGITFMRGALSKYCWNFSASSVADMTTTFRSLRLNIICSKAKQVRHVIIMSSVFCLSYALMTVTQLAFVMTREVLSKGSPHTRTSLSSPISTSVESVLSCASSKMMQLYLQNRESNS